MLPPSRQQAATGGSCMPVFTTRHRLALLHAAGSRQQGRVAQAPPDRLLGRCGPGLCVASQLKCMFWGRLLPPVSSMPPACPPAALTPAPAPPPGPRPLPCADLQSRRRAASSGCSMAPSPCPLTSAPPSHTCPSWVSQRQRQAGPAGEAVAAKSIWRRCCRVLRGSLLQID